MSWRARAAAFGAAFGCSTPGRAGTSRSAISCVVSGDGTLCTHAKRTTRRASSRCFGVLLLNGVIAFCLNLAVVLLIKNASSLVLTLGGVVKDILIISLSAFFFSAPVSFVQAFGYTFAIGGLVLYKRYKSDRDWYNEHITLQWFTGGCKPQNKYEHLSTVDGADADE